MIPLLFLLLVNLSAALKTIEPNKGVGLLDTDVYGPSVPLMMNLHETPQLTKGTLLHCSCSWERDTFMCAKAGGNSKIITEGFQHGKEVKNTVFWENTAYIF